MITQLEENLLHVERSREGLNQHRSSNRVMRYPDVRLGEEEDIVPQPRFLVVLHLWKIEVRSVAVLHELVSIVEEVHRKVEE